MSKKIRKAKAINAVKLQKAYDRLKTDYTKLLKEGNQPTPDELNEVYDVNDPSKVTALIAKKQADMDATITKYFEKDLFEEEVSEFHSVVEAFNGGVEDKYRIKDEDLEALEQKDIDALRDGKSTLTDFFETKEASTPQTQQPQTQQHPRENATPNPTEGKVEEIVF